jgi:hypothetical protein
MAKKAKAKLVIKKDSMWDMYYFEVSRGKVCKLQGDSRGTRKDAKADFDDILSAMLEAKGAKKK